MIAAHSYEFWNRLCKLMEREVIQDPRTATQEARVANQERVYDAVGSFVGRHTKRELKERLGGEIVSGLAAPR